MIEVIDDATIQIGDTFFVSAIRSDQIGHAPGLCVRCFAAPVAPGWMVYADEGGMWVITSSLCVPCMGEYEGDSFYPAAVGI
jgi:hypothetical protein